MYCGLDLVAEELYKMNVVNMGWCHGGRLLVLDLMETFMEWLCATSWLLPANESVTYSIFSLKSDLLTSVMMDTHVMEERYDHDLLHYTEHTMVPFMPYKYCPSIQCCQTPKHKIRCPSSNKVIIFYPCSLWMHLLHWIIKLLDPNNSDAFKWNTSDLNFL